MSSVDFIIIGTSPICLTKAAILKAQGQNVLVLDSSSQVGGAWKTLKYDNLPEVEIGCHIWSYHKEGYDLLERLFDIKIPEMSPQPLMTKGNISIPYDLKSNVISLKNYAKALVKFNRKTISAIKQNPSFRLSVIPAKYKYPLKGALDLKPKLEAFVERHRIDVSLGIQIDDIIISDDGVSLLTSDGHIIKSNEGVWASSLSELNTISINGNSHAIKKREESYIHYHLQIKASKFKKLSYHRILGDPVFHRISDMSTQATQLSADERIFSLAIFKSAYENLREEERIEKIVSFLSRRKYVSSDFEIVAMNHNVYNCSYVDRGQINSIMKASNGKLGLIHSTDFVYSFVNLKDEINKLLLSDT